MKQQHYVVSQQFGAAPALQSDRQRIPVSQDTVTLAPCAGVTVTDDGVAVQPRPIAEVPGSVVAWTA